MHCKWFCGDRHAEADPDIREVSALLAKDLATGSTDITARGD